MTLTSAHGWATVLEQLVEYVKATAMGEVVAGSERRLYGGLTEELIDRFGPVGTCRFSRSLEPISKSRKLREASKIDACYA
jgi:hypothetical protein